MGILAVVVFDAVGLLFVEGAGERMSTGVVGVVLSYEVKVVVVVGVDGGLNKVEAGVADWAGW